MKKTVVLLLIVALLCQGIVYAKSEIFSDIQGHWAEVTINKWVGQGLISGYPDGTFRPDQTITRGEFVSLVNTIYGFMSMADNYEDVYPDEWYYQAVAIGKNSTYLSWYKDKMFYPNKAITREEVSAILYHILQLDQKNLDSSLSQFMDHEVLASWSYDYLNGLVASGYVSGYPDETLRATSPITRAETLAMLDKVIGLYISDAEYGSSVYQMIKGNVTVSNSSTLKNMTIDGDLIISAGVGDGEVILDHVVVLGQTVIDGGGPNSVILRNTTLKKVVIRKEKNIRLVTEESEIEKILHFGSGTLEGEFSKTDLYFMKEKGQLKLIGDFGDVYGQKENLLLELEGSIRKLIANGSGKILGTGRIKSVLVNTIDYTFKITIDEEILGEGVVVIDEEETPQGAVTPPVVTPPVVTPPTN